MTTRLMDSVDPHRLARERGATLPEYALLVALVVVVALGAITRLQESSSDQLEERESSSGASAEISGSGFTYGGGGGGSTGGDDGGTPSTVTVDSVTFSKPTAKKESPADSWVATVTVLVKSGGSPVANANVAVTFTYGSSTNSFTCPLPSNDKGEVVCQQTAIPEGVDSATMVVTGVSGINIAYSAPSPQPSQGFSKPKG